MPLSKRALVVALLVASQGCYIDFKRPGGPKVVAASPRKQSKQFGGDNRPRGGGFGPKIVEDKKPPSRLIANDGTSCTVSDKKYHSTNLGATVWCTWFDTNR